MKNLLKIFLILAIISVFSVNLKSQYPSFPYKSGCAVNGSSQSASIPTNGNIKAVLVYYKFKGDNFDLAPYTDTWPSSLGTELPNWAYNVLSPTIQTSYPDPSLSGYFKSMSLGNYNFIGDEYPNNGQVYESRDPKESYFQFCGGGPKRLSYAVYEALTDLDAQIDYTQYDNDGIDGIPNSGDDDGYVDFIVMWFRFHMAGCTDGSQYSGIANLTGFNYEFIPGVSEILTNDIGHNNQPIKIGPGSGVIAEGLSDKGINIFAHEIGHQMNFGHDPWQGYYSLMTWEGMGAMNSWERKQLGWINDYITISSTVYNYPLRDYETYGDAIKINYNNGNESGYYLIENRQRTKYYSSSEWMAPDEGVLIDRYQEFGVGSGYNQIQCADHKWNWENTNGLYVYPYNRTSPSNSGYYEMDIFGNSPYTNNCVNLPGTNCGAYDRKYHPDAHGDAKDLWDIGYNQVFSTWSNPQSSMSNFSIELKSKDINGTMYLDIVFENPEQLSPAKPIWLRTTSHYFDPNNPHKFHPKLDWQANLEPDLTNYKILRGLVTTPNVDPTYIEIATISSSLTTYIDEQITLYDEQTASLSCPYDKKTYVYRITAMDNQSKISVRSDSSEIEGYEDPCIDNDGDNMTNLNNLPEKFSILNYPNPFNPTTEIRYELPQSTYVTIKIFNSLGEEITRLVNNVYKNAGKYNTLFDGSNFASGIYFYSIQAGTFSATKKMVLIK